MLEMSQVPIACILYKHRLDKKNYEISHFPAVPVVSPLFLTIFDTKIVNL